ncbi:hypothetical protein Moror_16738, partial [Moniliophthora roreri MCA 2997]
FREDIDFFSDIVPEEGIVIVAFGLKGQLEALGRGKSKKGGIDATFNTNSSGLELYSIMGEHDNTGMPLSYCLVMTILKDHYGVDYNGGFVHVDKDMAEIEMIQEAWKLAKIQICLYHMKKAVRRHIGMAKLATTPYQPDRAHAYFLFIDSKFKLAGKPDKAEHEGGILDNGVEDKPRKQRGEKKKAHTIHPSQPQCTWALNVMSLAQQQQQLNTA